jgi:inosine-uridine nucleoside N-ribohydrolase
VRRIHLDTDIGCDTDDLCALVMALGWPEAEITGITTVTERGGARAGFARRALALAGRPDIPVAAGAEGSLAAPRFPAELQDARYWPPAASGCGDREAPDDLPSAAGSALDLLERSLALGATLVAIGPYTNLALLEVMRPGALREAAVVAMGGQVSPMSDGLPTDWGPEYNVHQDSAAAQVLFERCRRLTLIELPTTLQVTLRVAQLPGLRASGPLGTLIAHQAVLRQEDHRTGELSRRYPRLPADLLNFQYDPLAVAAALGWDGVQVEEQPLTLSFQDGVVRLAIGPSGTSTRVVTGVDAPRFDQVWLEAVRRADSRDAAS